MKTPGVYTDGSLIGQKYDFRVYSSSPKNANSECLESY